MRYTLITAKGRVYTFFVLAVAETFKQAYGGTLFTAQDLAFQSLTEKLQQPELMAVLTRMKDR